MINDNMRDLDYVEIEFDWTDEEIEILFHFSEYSRNKIKLMYGSKINRLFFMDVMDNPNRMSNISSNIPIGYRVSNNDFIMPFKFFKQFIYNMNMSNLLKDDDIKHVDVAISNQDSYEKLYKALKDHHHSIIDSLDNSYEKFK